VRRVISHAYFRVQACFQQFSKTSIGCAAWIQIIVRLRVDDHFAMTKKGAGSAGSASSRGSGSSKASKGVASSPLKKKTKGIGSNPQTVASVSSPGKQTSGSKSSKIKADHGILLGLDHTDENMELAFDGSGSLERLFGDTKGAPLIDEIFSWFGAGAVDVPWFVTGSRGIIPSPLNRQIQETVCESYKNRIFEEGLAQDVAGILGEHK
jgi:hypothetical protein